MKARIVKAHDEFKVGDSVDIAADKYEILANTGFAITEGEWQANQMIVKAREKRVDDAISKATDEHRLPPKADVARIRASAITMEEASEGVGCEYILSLPIQGTQDLTARLTKASGDLAPTPGLEIRASVQDHAEFVIKSTAPQDALIKAGSFGKALELARQVGSVVKHRIIKAGEDMMLGDLVKAATFVDPNGTAGTSNNTGSLAADLIIMRNLGYLVNKLAWLKYLTTDLTGEPVKFGQTILTRYITPPAVLTWVPGVGFTNPVDAGGSAGFGAQQISDSGTGTTQSGGKTIRSGGGGNYETDATNNFGIPVKSFPLVTDKSVALDMFKATEIEFPVSLLAGTVRNLFGEQLGAQTYSLAEEINKFMMAKLYAATWTGIKTSYTKALTNWNLSGMIGIKNAMTISKIPDVGRFILLHSFYHDKLLEDSNLLAAKAIMALIHKDEAEFNTGSLPTLFGVRPLESQLSSATTAGALTTWTDDTNLGTTIMTGFAGNMSSGLFVSRPPQDFTQIATQLGIPNTASIRLMTEPDSGLTVMVFSYVDNGKMSINQRVCLMYGGAQGDPRVGIILKAA